MDRQEQSLQLGCGDSRQTSALHSKPLQAIDRRRQVAGSEYSHVRRHLTTLTHTDIETSAFQSRNIKATNKSLSN